MKHPLCMLLAVAWLALPGRAEEYHPTPEDIRQGQVDPDVPAFVLPPLEGERYQDRVPDTLDLAAMADLALNGLTGPNDPRAGYELYFTANFQRNPPVMLHDFSDVCQTKFLGPMLLLRSITGTDTGRETEEAIFTEFLRATDANGLWCPPLKGRKWFRENLWEEAKGAEQPDAALPPYEGGRLHGRIVEAWLILWKLTGDTRWKDRATAMVTNGVQGDIARYVRETNEWGLWPGTDETKLPKGFLACDAWTPQALAQYYRETGDDVVRQAAHKQILQQRDHIEYFLPSGEWILTTPGVAPAHFHAHALSILGFLQYAVAAQDAEMLDYARRSYEWARAQGSALTGFFPENIKPGHPNSEGCAVADMIALAIKLSQAGAGDYWDDADRWLRNAFEEFQLTPEKARQLAKAAKRNPKEEPKYNENADHVIERNIGAFAGWPGGNEWMQRIGIQHCCTGNCARTLYYAWESVLDFDGKKLCVNLLMNRASPCADVHSCIPNEGRVELNIKADCESIVVRAPEWIPTGGELHCEVDGATRDVSWQGRYVSLGEGEPGQRFSLSFPIAERTEKNSMGGADYTLTLRGSTVVAIDPPGTVCPLYQREASREPVRWKSVQRFVSSKPLDW